MLKIYQQYQIYGVEEYYKNFSCNYFNPHEEKIEQIYMKHIKDLIKSNDNIIDIACGDGLISRLVHKYNNNYKIVGCDPHFNNEYCKLNLSFEDIAKGRCGVSTKDNWDPADIYMVRKTKENEIRKKLDSITKNTDEMANIYSLNAYMRELIQSKDLLPVSLKAISKTKTKADLELSNMGKGKAKEIIFENVGPLKCYANFGTNSKTPTEIDNGEIAGQFKAGESLVNWQTRNFNMSTPRGGVQTDLTPTGKDAGAKIGKASADAIDEFFSKNYSKLGIIRPVNAGKDPHIPPVGKWTPETIKYWVDFQKELSKFKVNNMSVDFGDMKVMYKGKQVSSGSFAEVLDYCIREEGSKYAGGRLSSKLTCMRWAYAWAVIDKKGLMQDWLKTLYYGAKKEFRDTNGPFIKIY
jgi:hypothetical protein